PGECHYQDGNQKAKARLVVIEEMLSLMGLDQERFRLVWCSSAEAERFAAIVQEVTDRLKEIGPSPYRPDASDYVKREALQCL
ncbi:MAG: hydrogenase iron-sulfur subunit, partial [Desulfobacteraceae bacterium]|nr:hydrogenase iron-sulfur subunit [Desulfobacteraceae bacterium]